MTLALLLAGLAVAYLVLSRPAAPAGLPPLVPSAPALPSLAPASPAAGVSPFLLGAILLPWCLLAWTHLVQATPAPTPAPPSPTPAIGLDLRGKFVGEQAAEDAAITAELLSALAEAVCYDGAQPEPRLRTGQQLAELRSTAREYRTAGMKLGDRQPLARDEIARYLEERVGTDGGPVDTAARGRWVDGFREVSKAAHAAIGR